MPGASTHLCLRIRWRILRIMMDTSYLCHLEGSNWLRYVPMSWRLAVCQVYALFLGEHQGDRLKERFYTDRGAHIFGALAPQMDQGCRILFCQCSVLLSLFLTFLLSRVLAEQGSLKDTFFPFETWLFPPKQKDTTIYKAMFRCIM